MFSFLSTFRSFDMTAAALCQLWMDLYVHYEEKSSNNNNNSNSNDATSDNNSNNDNNKELSRRLYLFLKYWIDNFSDDFKGNPLFNELLTFTHKHLSKREVNILKLCFLKVINLYHHTYNILLDIIILCEDVMILTPHPPFNIQDPKYRTQ